MTTVGAAIPSIPPRSGLLVRAIESALHQTRPVDALSVVIDHQHAGAAATRNAAWRALQTDYVAFLDDDDEWLPTHVGLLLDCAVENDADLVFPWFSCTVGDPFPETFGQPWDPQNPRQTTITCLWRRDALERVHGFPPHSRAMGPDSNWIGEDYLAVLNLNAAGGKIVHLPERTWIWNQHHGSTCGLPERWVA